MFETIPKSFHFFFILKQRMCSFSLEEDHFRQKYRIIFTFNTLESKIITQGGKYKQSSAENENVLNNHIM